MAWDFISVSTYAEVSSGNLTLNAPASAQQGDLLVACIAYRSNAAFTPNDGSWNLVATQQSSGDTDATQGIASGVMYYCIRGASDPGFQFNRTSGDVAQGTVLCYRGGASSSIYDTGNAATLGTIGEPALSEITTAGANELIIAMISAGDNSLTSAVDAVTAPNVASGGTDTTTDPTADTWIERFDRGSNTGADTGLCVADGLKSTAGATGAFSADAVTTTRSVFIVGAFKKGANSYSMTMGGGALAGGSATIAFKKPIVLKESSWIPAGGTTSTTRRLSIPSGKSSGDFEAGKISDDTNPLASFDPGSGKFSDWEVCFEAVSGIVGNNDEIEFRITNNGTVLDSYTRTPKLTISSVQSKSVTMAGGGIGGGTATTAFQKTKSVAMAGGGLAGGESVVKRGRAYSGSGGGIAGGAAVITAVHSISVTMSGGGLGGGAATIVFQKSLSLTMSGGSVAGGLAPLVAQKFITGLGGGIAGGVAPTAFQKTKSVAMSGGGIAGGTATTAFQRTLSVTMAGGGIAGGAATLVFQHSKSLSMSGGAIAGGAADKVFQYSKSLSMTGGALAGGGASYSLNYVGEPQSYQMSMSGGAIVGGTAPYQSVHSLSVSMSGGGIAGGIATIVLQQSKSVAMSGGAIGGGAVGIVAGKVFSGSGGGVAGGSAIVSAVHSLNVVMAGGGVAGGSASLIASKILSGAGGGVGGGSASTTRGLFHVIQGGAVAGGSAAYQFQTLAETVFIVMQGGGVGGGSAGISGAYIWPRTEARRGGGAVFLQTGPEKIDVQELRRQIQRKAEREAEERMIMAAIKMFLENEYRWAA